MTVAAQYVFSFLMQKNTFPICIKMTSVGMEIPQRGMDTVNGSYGERLSRQQDFTDNPVPVGLGVFGVGMTAGVDLLRDATAIVDHNIDNMPTRLQPVAKTIFLRS